MLNGDHLLDLLGVVDCDISAYVYVYYVNQCICGERELWQVSCCRILFACLFVDRLDHALSVTMIRIALPVDLFVCFNDSYGSASTVCRTLSINHKPSTKDVCRLSTIDYREREPGTAWRVTYLE